MQNPMDYKTQNGLLKALNKIHETKSASVSIAWWLKNAEFTLIEKWGWLEKEAARFIACYMPRESAYIATGRS